MRNIRRKGTYTAFKKHSNVKHGRKKKGDLWSPQHALKCETWGKKKGGTYKALKKHSKVKNLNACWGLHKSPFICETWIIHMWNMTHAVERHEVFIFTCGTWRIDTCGTWLIHMRDMTHSVERHEVFIMCVCVTRLIHTRDMTQQKGTCKVLNTPIICGTWLIHLGDMTHSREWHDSFIYVTWSTPMGHDSFICWLIHMLTHSYVNDSFIWDMTHSYHDSFIRGTWIIPMGHDAFICWLMHMGHDSFTWDMTYSYHDSFIRGT